MIGVITAVLTSELASKRGSIKVVDVEFRSGRSKLREEVWEDLTGNVVRYNLAFIDHGLFSGDNGRVLGYDSAHGYHHRHFMGKVEPIEFPGYEKLAERFFKEAAALRERKKI